LANNEDNDHPTDPAREGSAFLLEGPLTEADARQRDRQKKDDEYKRRQLLFNRLLVVVGLLTVGVYAYQAYIMNGSLEKAKTSADAAQSAAKTADATLKAMTSGAVETGAQIERLIKQQQRTADSMEQNLARSKAALDASIEASRNDQRAWVTNADMVPNFMDDKGVPTWVMEGRKLTFGVKLQNSGKSPALDVECKMAAKVFPKEIPFSPIYDPSERPPSRIVMRPGGIGEIDTSPSDPLAVDITAEILADITSGRKRLCAYGEITYRDIFERHHVTTFCAYLSEDLRTFMHCNTYNYAN
jgi:hypothetical protein